MYVLLLTPVFRQKWNGPDKSLTLAFVIACPQHPLLVSGCEWVVTQAELMRHICLSSSHQLSPSRSGAATHCRNNKTDALCQWLLGKTGAGFCFVPTGTVRLFSIPLQIIYNLFWTPSSLRLNQFLFFSHCNSNSSSLCVTQSYFRLSQGHKSPGLMQVHC